VIKDKRKAYEEKLDEPLFTICFHPPSGHPFTNIVQDYYRSDAEDGEYVKINPSLIPADGSPTSFRKM